MNLNNFDEKMLTAPDEKMLTSPFSWAHRKMAPPTPLGRGVRTPPLVLGARNKGRPDILHHGPQPPSRCLRGGGRGNVAGNRVTDGDGFGGQGARASCLARGGACVSKKEHRSVFSHCDFGADCYRGVSDPVSGSPMSPRSTLVVPCSFGLGRPHSGTRISTLGLSSAVEECLSCIWQRRNMLGVMPSGPPLNY